MSQDSLDNTADDFDAQMEKRRRMFEITGAVLPEYSRDNHKDARFEKSVSNCYFCKDTELCDVWLEENTGLQDPPEFCPNHDLIKSIQNKAKLSVVK